MQPSSSAPAHVDVLVVGGGNGGIAVAARLRREGIRDIAVVEPKVTHHFRPLLSYVGAGLATVAELSRSQESVMPDGVRWIQDSVQHIDPAERRVRLGSGAEVGYRDVVLTPGSEPDWDAVPGSAEAMLSPAGSTNYLVDLAPKTWQLVQAIRSGRAVFTLPDGPAPCAGAGQKILYMACDYWQDQGVLGDIEVTLVTPDRDVSQNGRIADELRRWVERYGIRVLTGSRVERVDPAERVLQVTGGTGATTVPYDLLHMTPVHRAQAWLADAGLSSTAAGGYVDVDPLTLRHPRFGSVWACGDASETGASRSGGALRKQTEVLAANLLAARRGEDLPEAYDGYSVCPYTVSRSRVVFAEFDREHRLTPTLPLPRPLRPRRTLFAFDRRVLPQVYWRRILKGR